MTNYYIQSMDPQEISARFSNEEMITPFEDAYEFEWKEDHLEKIRDFLPRLPDREADLIELYFFYNKKQTEIAQIFELTQAAVSYRLKRALERLRFLMEMPDLSAESIQQDLSSTFSEVDVQIFQEMFATTCQSEVANRLHISQGKVRHRFLNALHSIAVHIFAVVLEEDVLFREDRQQAESLYSDRDLASDVFCAACNDLLAKWYAHTLEDPDAYPPDLRKWLMYFRTFQKIRQNFNILREVKLPKWHDRSKRTLG